MKRAMILDARNYFEKVDNHLILRYHQNLLELFVNESLKKGASTYFFSLVCAVSKSILYVKDLFVF